MPTVTEVLDALEARIATIEGLRTYDTWPDTAAISGNASAAIIGVPAIPDYHATMGRARWTIEPTITVFTSAAMDRRGQRKLAAFADQKGPTSIIAAIEGDTGIGGSIDGDKTLGGVVEDCIVVSFRPLGLEEYAAYGAYGGVFDLRIIARGA